MRSMVYATVVRLSVRLSVPSIDSSNGGPRGEFAAERPLGTRYRWTAGSAVLQAPALSSKCG